MGNFIGTDRWGSADTGLGNAEYGIEVGYGAGGLQIGGTEPGSRNVISANGAHGIDACPSDWVGGTQILGNHIGTDVTGRFAAGNTGHGVFVCGFLSAPEIGGTTAAARNVISANGLNGIRLSPEFPGQEKVLGNFIGTDVIGSLALGNAQSGVVLESEGPNPLRLGGTIAGARNVISGNGERGVYVNQVNWAEVLGNYVGTDATGAWAIPNAGAGVEVFRSRATIGGTDPGAGNLVSGNGSVGIEFRLNANDTSSVLGNFVGVDADGLAPIGNGSHGVRVRHVSAQVLSIVIGGTSAESRNLISGNDDSGIYLEDVDGVRIQGNWIGLDASGSGIIGNLRGIQVFGAGNSIGGMSDGSGNTIVGSTEYGISVLGTQNELGRNSIHSNGELGIDLGQDGVTANDFQDPDVGPNLQQNFPDLASATATPAAVTVVGNLNSVPLSDYRVEFFAGATCDPSGHGEGDRFLGSVDVSADANGDASLNAVLGAGASAGEAITATATDSSGNTSEFSSCVSAACSSSVPFGGTVRAPSKDALGWPTSRAMQSPVARGGQAVA